MKSEIEELEDLFDELDVDYPTAEQLQKMYGIYLNDFIREYTFFRGRKVIVDSRIIKSKKEGCFVNKQTSFDHIITRESKLANKRKYDRNRANKIHWVKVIIDNDASPLVKTIEDVDKNGCMVIKLWLESKNYVVILREKQPNLYLVTGYCVDEIEKGRFKREYEAYRNKKTPLRK